MPKLSKYVQEASQQHPDVAAEPGTLYLATDAAAGPAAPAGRPAASTRSTLGGSSQGGRSTLLSPQHQAAAAKLKEDFNKRIREHGPRVFRWPDGSLRPDKPPPSPYAAANRRKWQPLVQHCRTHGDERSFEQSGQSLRYGINVSAAEHAAYLQQAGLEPELNEAGEPRGYTPAKQDPLEDPSHCFHTFYGEGAEAVFARSRGRLL